MLPMKQEINETQLLVKKVVSAFFKRDIRHKLHYWKELFSPKPELFYQLLYNLMSTNPKEYKELLKKNLKPENETTADFMNFFRELNVLLTSSDLELINKSELFVKLIKAFEQNKENEREILNFMKEIARPLYIQLLLDFDQLRFYQLLVKKGLIKNEKILILELEKMKKEVHE